MGAVKLDLNLEQGKTLEAAFGWSQGKYVWKAISGVGQGAPLQLTAVGHDLVDGWPYWISDLKEPACLNNVKNGCEGEADELGDAYLAEVVDADTLAVNHLNGARFKPYTVGGVIRYFAREDISGYTARMQIRRTEHDDTVLFEASSTGSDPLIAVDEDAATFYLTLPATALEGASFTSGVYEIEITSPDGRVSRLAYGSVCLSRDGVR